MPNTPKSKCSFELLWKGKRSMDNTADPKILSFPRKKLSKKLTNSNYFCLSSSELHFQLLHCSLLLLTITSTSYICISCCLGEVKIKIIKRNWFVYKECVGRDFLRIWVSIQSRREVYVVALSLQCLAEARLCLALERLYHLFVAYNTPLSEGSYLGNCNLSTSANQHNWSIKTQK